MELLGNASQLSSFWLLQYFAIPTQRAASSLVDFLRQEEMHGLWPLLQWARLSHDLLFIRNVTVMLTLMTCVMFTVLVAFMAFFFRVSMPAAALGFLIRMFLGILQVIYATYQFAMIGIDVAGILLLRLYSQVRNEGLFSFPIVTWWTTNCNRHRRRQEWQAAVEQADSYESFLKIRLVPIDKSKREGSWQMVNATISEKIQSDLMNDMKRSASFASTGTSSVASLATSTSSLSVSISGFAEGRGTTGIPQIRSRSFSTLEDDATWKHISINDDEITDDEASTKLDVSVSELSEKTATMLITTASRLREARITAEQSLTEGAVGTLKHLLSSVVKRNHLTLDDIAVENGRAVAHSGENGLSQPSRQLIRNYYQEVEKGLQWLAEAPEIDPIPLNEPGHRPGDLTDRITLIRKMKQTLGRTALMLSGGGAQAMYHMGVIRALIESKLYDDISVIAGTSGGSIIAAICAIKTAEELYRDVCISKVSVDYTGNGAPPGTMKKEDIRWFPTMIEMAHNWFNTGIFVDSARFKRTCEFYFSDYTFEEAFQLTGRHVCITVSASHASCDTAQRHLLNHISTPRVTLASAVAASCALPGVMAPVKLIGKNSAGILEPFDVDGVEWIDGSVQADLPFQAVSCLFSVTNFIVSQTNFPFVPFIIKDHDPSRNSLYWQLFNALEWDIRGRGIKLGRLGLFPYIGGQDLSHLFKQEYQGNLTIVPKFTISESLGLKVLSNPTEKQMTLYIKNGQIATWPYLNAMRDMIRIEKVLDNCLKCLEDRVRALTPDLEASFSTFDDLESTASSSGASHSSQRVRFGVPTSLNLETDRVRQKCKSLEEENQGLKAELYRLQKLLGQEGERIEEVTNVNKQIC